MPGLAHLIIDLDQSIVLATVIHMPLVILVRVLYHRNNQDENEREGHGRFAIGDGDKLDCLHDGNYEEVDVRGLFELVH